MRFSQTTAAAWRAVVLLGFLCAAASFLSLHTVGHIKDRAVGLVLHGQKPSLAALAVDFGIADGVAMVFLVAGLLLAAWLERRERGFSLLVGATSPAAFLAAISILLAWLGHAYFFPGVLLGGDTGTHIARFLEVRRGLEAGSLPQWTNYQYLGSPLLGFTGPLTYVVGGVVDLFLRDAVATAKLLLFGLHMAAGWLCFALLRRLGLERLGAAAGALGFAGSFAILHLFLYRGVFPQAFTIVFFLVVFFTAEGLMRAERWPWPDWAGFALGTGGLIINHQPHALFVAVYLALFGAVGLAVGRWRLAGLRRLVTAGLLGVAISTVAVLPIVIEADWVMIEPEGAMFSFRLPTPERLLHLVMWRNTRTTWGTDYWAYLGIVLVLLALAGTVAGLRGRFASPRFRLVLSVLPCLGLSLFLANPVVRDIMFLLLFVAILGGIGADALRERLVAWPRAGLVLMLALLLDLSSTAIQPVARTDKAFLVDAGRYLEAVAPNQRMMGIALDAAGQVDADVGPDAGPASYQSTIQRIAGHHNMAATRVHNDAETAVALAATDLDRGGTLSRQSRDLLALFNVGRIVCADAVANGCPGRFVEAQPDGPLGAVVHIPSATPVLFSRHLTALPPRPGLDKPMLWREDFKANAPRIASVADFMRDYLDLARPDWPARMAASLPVFAIPAGLAETSGAGAWHPRLDSYAVSLDKVAATVTVDAQGYVQLSHPWFPSNVVRVNGAAVAPIEGALHLVVVPVQAGTSTIEITPSVTPVRVASLWVSAAAAAATLLIALAGGLRQRRAIPANDPGG